MSNRYAEIIAGELQVTAQQVAETLALFAEGGTIPFIARYRKERTGNLDEVQIGAIEARAQYLKEIDERRQTVLDEIGRQGKLTDLLRAKIEGTLSKTELEDLYLPYKPKRRTRAMIAREKGLQPLADLVWSQTPGGKTRDEIGQAFVTEGVADVAAAFAGARDIVAELVSEDADIRADLRAYFLDTATIAASVIDGKQVEGAKFKDYFDHREPIAQLPSHRMLAIRRGEKDGFLRVLLEVDEGRAVDIVRARVRVGRSAELGKDLEAALADSFSRLLQPSIEVDVRLALKERADEDAIKVFAENMRNLLLQSPLGQKRMLGVDPGFRTGCKVVALDAQGNLLAHEVAFIAQSEGQKARAEEQVVRLCKQHRVEAIAIGNGTGGRETETFFRELKAAGKIGDAVVVMVNESGASVYSASEIAREEFPNEDITVRGAVSIGRRLQDPLAELVKLDPKAVGVGQYQHDVNQVHLSRMLDGVVESCVNRVGVDVNTASVKLLQYVAGIGDTIAKNIVAYRAQHGAFGARRELLNVTRLGARAYEQAAGFLRVRGENPLDNSAVHPESYEVVEKMARDLAVPMTALVGHAELVRKISPEHYIDDKRGLPTLKDILAELEKPGRDPREQFEEVGFDPEITAFEHLKEGMVLKGVITNVTQFGAFVDVGVHQDGLVHISELADRFVKDPAEVAKVGDRVNVRVLQIDASRRRIALSMKSGAARPQPTNKPITAQKPNAPQKPSPPRAPEKIPFNNPFAALTENR